MLARDVAAIREQIMQIEANAHPDYGGGFRDCVDALRGRTLHSLLTHVKLHAKLPPPAAAAASAGAPGDEGEPERAEWQAEHEQVRAA